MPVPSSSRAGLGNNKYRPRPITDMNTATDPATSAACRFVKTARLSGARTTPVPASRLCSNAEVITVCSVVALTFTMTMYALEERGRACVASFASVALVQQLRLPQRPPAVRHHRGHLGGHRVPSLSAGCYRRRVTQLRPRL